MVIDRSDEPHKEEPRVVVIMHLKIMQMVAKIWIGFLALFFCYSMLVYSFGDRDCKEGSPNAAVVSGWRRIAKPAINYTGLEVIWVLI